jgi:hypothetical protein
MKKCIFYLNALLITTIILISCGQQKTSENKTSTTNETNRTEIIIKRNPEQRLDVANVFWKKEYTLFDLITDEPIFPITKGGLTIYQIYYSSNEDPTPHFGEFTPEQLEEHLFYKFKNKENCIKFCDSK